MIKAQFKKEKANFMICKRFARVEMDDMNLEKLIVNKLPANIKDYKNYVCDFSMEFKIYGVDEEEIKVTINREGNECNE